MEELKKLVKIVTSYSKKNISLLNIGKVVPENKEETLFIKTRNGQYDSDKAALTDLYYSTTKSYRYRMLKSRLLKKLYNHLFFVESNIRTSKSDEKKCIDLIYKGKVLIQVIELPLAEKLFTKALKIAERYEFTDLSIDCLSNLNLIYSQQQNYLQFHKSLAKLKRYKKIKSYEDEASEIYFVSKLELLKSVASQKKYLTKLPSAIAKLKMLWNGSSSFSCYYYYFMLNGWYLELIGNFEESIKDIERCESLIKAGKINPLRFEPTLNKYSLVYALFRAKKHEEGLKVAKKYKNDFNPQTRNWFAYMSNYFLLAMHAGKYQLATDIIVEVDLNANFKKLKNKDKESWALYKAYIYFINPRESIIVSFNYQRFVTSVPEHSKDKLGHNIALHILQFMYYLKNKDFDQLYYKEGALRKYLSTYLKDPDSQRSRFFFRLLIVAIRADFGREKTVKKGQKWFDKLKSSPQPGDAFAKIEIIPYEKLWEIILNFMEEK